MPGSTSTRGPKRRELCVVFEIEPAGESNCPLNDFDGEIADVRHQISGEECQTDTTVRAAACDCSPQEDCTEVVYSTNEVDDTCPCTVFGEYDCVPELVGTVDDRLLLQTFLSDRERLSELVASLKAVSSGLRLRQLKRIDASGADTDENTVTLDLYEITEKQREAVAKAVGDGYYSSPRETSLEELAEDFSISTSALSQRLNAAESKLATAAFTQSSADAPGD